jgi:acetyl esterase/lipase
MTTVLWAYAGRRRFEDDPDLALGSVVDHITPAFPPTFVTVGNADPLRVHSEALADRLAARGVEVDTVFWPETHEPPLGHEYQFDLDGEAGRLAFDRMLAFLRRR